MFRKTSAAFAWWALTLVCIASFSLMLSAARTDSAIVDELAHIPAGYGYVHNLDYRLNPEHPPLVKALAMLPVLFLQPTFPTGSNAWTTEVNGQWDMGSQFLYHSGNDANAIIVAARIMPILLTILLIIFIYLLARGLMGTWWALLPATLFAFSPTVLAHGHYVTTDVGAAFGVIFASYFFFKFVESPSTKKLWWAGLAFGVAQAMKFSTPLLVPLDIFLMVVLAVRDTAAYWNQSVNHFKPFFTRLGRNVWRLVLIFAIGYVFIVYPIYFIFTLHYPIARQVSDTTTILNSFATGPTPAGQICKGIRCLAELDIRMAHSMLFRPYAQYLLGILMVLQRSDSGNTIYFMGQVRPSGGWTYFPTLFLLKETIPTLIIVFVALILALWWMLKRERREGRGRWQRILDYIGVNFAEFAMASFIILYWGYSMRSTLNIGIRHLMPTIPFIYILAAGVWKKWITRINFMAPTSGSAATLTSMMASASAAARYFLWSTIKYLFLLLLLVWLVVETFVAAPYFLSYFNEFAGGTMNGYHYVTDSNYDWGQDLLRLQQFVKAHPEIDTIAVDYFGGGNPKYYLGAKEVDWSSSKGDPTLENIHWLVVSVNQLESAIQPLAPGETRNVADSYPWLTALRPPASGIGNVPPPDYRVGTSLFVYHL